MKYKLYVAKNDGILHLVIRKNNRDVLLCNKTIKASKYRIAKIYEDVWIIAPTPNRKHTCAKCVMANKKLPIGTTYTADVFRKQRRLKKDRFD